MTEDRRQRWLDVVGADYWSLVIADWTLLAMNAQLARSGLAAEASQWSWLEDQLRCADPGQRIALLAFYEPDGIRHLIQGADIPDPYRGR